MHKKPLHTSVFILIILGIHLFNSNVFSQQIDPPLTFEQVVIGLKSLTTNLISARQLNSSIRERKVDFEVTKDIEEKLRNNGATLQIIKTIKDSFAALDASLQATPKTRTRKIKSFKNQQTGIEFVVVPKGSFMMGSSDAENEMPVRKITFTEDFFIGKYEVTQGEWQELMGNAKEKVLSVKGENKVLDEILGENYPRVGVSWDDAKQFIAKLNELNDGYVYSLPSEAEWEYACRAGTDTQFAFGDDITSEQASYTNQSFSPFPTQSTPEKQINKLKPTGLYQPNAWGIYDMHGNAWEWVEDIYVNSYKGLSTDGTANTTKGDVEQRILRGGSWASRTRLYLRSSMRDDRPRKFANLATSFRIVAKLN